MPARGPTEEFPGVTATTSARPRARLRNFLGHECNDGVGVPKLGGWEEPHCPPTLF